MECPYPTATFEYIKSALMGGGQCTMFVSPERALANLVVAAWRDAAWNRILVVCINRLMEERLIRCLRDVLKQMSMSEKIVRCNAEMVVLFGGKELRVVQADPKYMRGVECDQLIFVRTEPMFVPPPVWEHCRDVYRLESSQEGTWNTTLQLVSIPLEKVMSPSTQQKW